MRGFNEGMGLTGSGVGGCGGSEFRALGTLPAVQVWGFGAQAQAKGGLQSEKPHGKHQIPSSFPRFTCGLSLAACSNHHDVLHVMLNLLVFATKANAASSAIPNGHAEMQDSHATQIHSDCEGFRSWTDGGTILSSIRLTKLNPTFAPCWTSALCLLAPQSSASSAWTQLLEPLSQARHIQSEIAPELDRLYRTRRCSWLCMRMPPQPTVTLSDAGNPQVTAVASSEGLSVPVLGC